MYGLVPSEGIQTNQEAMQNPVTEPDDASWYEGIPSAASVGLQNNFLGLANSAVTTADVLGDGQDTPAQTAFTGDNIFHDATQPAPDPKTTGWVGRMAYNLLANSTALEVGVVNPAAGAALAAGTNYLESGQDVYAHTHDLQAAKNVAGIQGGAALLMNLAPGSNLAPKSTLGRMAINAGTFMGEGAGARKLSSMTLNDAGYTDMADQYKWNDAMSLIFDGAFGMVSGLHESPEKMTFEDRVKAILKMPQSAVDAALYADNVNNKALDSAPGIPADIETANGHDQVMDNGTAAMDRGETPDVTPVLDGNFVEKPEAPVADTAQFSPPEEEEPAGANSEETLDSVEEKGNEPAGKEESPEGANPEEKEPSGEASAEMQPAAASELLNQAEEENPTTHGDDDYQSARRDELIAANPEMQIPDEDGNIMNAADAKQALDDEQQENDTKQKMYEAAAQCYAENGL